MKTKAVISTISFQISENLEKLNKNVIDYHTSFEHSYSKAGFISSHQFLDPFLPLLLKVDIKIGTLGIYFKTWWKVLIQTACTCSQVNVSVHVCTCTHTYTQAHKISYDTLWHNKSREGIVCLDSIVQVHIKPSSSV